MKITDELRGEGIFGIFVSLDGCNTEPLLYHIAAISNDTIAVVTHTFGSCGWKREDIIVIALNEKGHYLLVWEGQSERVYEGKDLMELDLVEVLELVRADRRGNCGVPKTEYEVSKDEYKNELSRTGNGVSRLVDDTMRIARFDKAAGRRYIRRDTTAAHTRESTNVLYLRVGKRGLRPKIKVSISTADVA